MRSEEAQIITDNRKGVFTNMNQLLDAGVSISTLEKLANADAFRSLGLNRREALWEVIALHDHRAGVFKGQPSESTQEGKSLLPQMSLSEHVVEDYGAISFSLKAHQVSFIREKLSLLHVTPTKDLPKGKNGDTIKVAGLVRMRQKPERLGYLVCYH